MAKVLSLAPSPQLLQTLADVAYMLSDAGREPIFETDVLAMCERFDRRAVRVALFWSVLQGELHEHGSIPNAYVVGQRLLELAHNGGFPEAA